MTTELKTRPKGTGEAAHSTARIDDSQSRKEFVQRAVAANATVPRLITPRAVADLAGYKSEVTILRLFRRGVLPGYKLGPRVVRFAETDVDAWLAAARVG
jgi:excisionase family DNA binding protein